MRLFLVVDDSQVVRSVAHRILSHLGFSVIEATNGHGALEVAREERPDFILVAWDLGNMSGIEFIEAYRNMPGADNTKILYCTSEVVISDMTRAKRIGANGFLMKPFNREVVTKKLLEAGYIEEDAQAA